MANVDSYLRHWPVDLGHTQCRSSVEEESLPCQDHNCKKRTSMAAAAAQTWRQAYALHSTLPVLLAKVPTPQDVHTLRPATVLDVYNGNQAYR